MTSTRRLRTAIAGLGRIGWGFHLQHCSHDPRFDVVAVVDKEAERCIQACDLFPACCSFATWEDFLAATVAVDIVVVATPTRLHQQMACDAISRGWHVVMEKPIAANVSEVDAIIAAEKAHERKVFLFQPHRWSAESRGVQEILDSGVLGPIYCIRRAYHTYRRRNDWQALSANGGGMLNNYGVHFVLRSYYLLHCLTGSFA